MANTAEQLAQLAELLNKELITRQEFDRQKELLLSTTGGEDTSAVEPDSYGDTAPVTGKLPDVSATATLEPTPTNVGAYLVKGEIGRGGMGIVYRARHRSAAFAEQQGGDVAVKVMHAHYSADPRFQARFEREASLGLKLDHPGLVRVFDLVVDRGVLALVMEMVEGTELSRVVGDERGPIPVPEVLPMFRQIAEAVDYAHSKGVIHRDLKPENVIVQLDGSLKILDFGIAKDPDSQATRTGTGMGTVYYMAPEQYTDARNVDKRADIYALGMTLYELLAGRLPWTGPEEVSDFSVMQMKAGGQVPPPTTHYPDIRPAVVEVVMSALCVDREERPPDALEFARRLEEAAAGQADKAGDGTPAEVAAVVSPEPVAPPPEPPAQSPLPPVVPPRVSPAPTSALEEPPASEEPPPEVASEESESLIPRFMLGFGGVIVLLLGLAICGGAGLVLVLAQEPVGVEGVEELVGPPGAVRGYFRAIDARNSMEAFEYFALGWSYERWEETLWDSSGCARVNDATTAWSEFGIGQVEADVCVEDTSAGVVHRWSGNVDVSKDGDRWVMTGWELSKVGTCSSTCTPP